MPTVMLRLVPLVVSLLLPAIARAAEEAPAPRVVKLVVSGDVSEDPKPAVPLGPTRRNFLSRLQQVRDIAADDEVAGVQLVLEGAPDFAHALDLVEELEALKAAGKPIVCYAETLGRGEAMIASVADLLAVPPSGMIVLEGLTAESMYMKDLLARFEVRFEVLHVGEYKTAYENLAREAMSEGQREVVGLILDEYWSQLVGTIATQRGMSADAVEALFGEVLVAPEQAAEVGLVDAVLYQDAFEARVDELFGGEVELVKGYGERTEEDMEEMLANPFAVFALLPELLDPKPPEAPDAPHVAVVYASGTINSGKSKVDFQGNVTSLGSETLVKALEQAADDEHCKAVVLRVNSPGGSALASDMIWRAVERVKSRGKPVVASMGSLAASGGYWISMGCDAIVAQPSTLTGSIGVVSMLPDVSTMLEEWGVNVEVVSRGPQGEGLALLKHGPTDLLRSRLQAWMGSTYEEFLSKVARGRGLEVERVRELAAGRVWTGRQAEELGLVDSLGGLSDAIQLAAAMAGVDGEAPLAELPAPPNFFDQLEESMEGMARAAAAGPAERVVRALGFSDLLDQAEVALEEPRALSPDRVLARLPFAFVIR